MSGGLISVSHWSLLRTERRPSTLSTRGVMVLLCCGIWLRYSKTQLHSRKSTHPPRHRLPLHLMYANSVSIVVVSNKTCKLGKTYTYFSLHICLCKVPSKRCVNCHYNPCIIFIIINSNTSVCCQLITLYAVYQRGLLAVHYAGTVQSDSIRYAAYERNQRRWCLLLLLMIMQQFQTLSPTTSVTTVNWISMVC